MLTVARLASTGSLPQAQPAFLDLFFVLAMLEHEALDGLLDDAHELFSLVEQLRLIQLNTLHFS